eukprot:Phypoly_transcript_16831.p1 GENE.Phypoly_transcript_16831~~Phypoly_transcript_16831.p1  ORF type:complete len:213 (+),score=23.11 Phypoly_transcript_16831:205-843(+)
MKDRKPFELRGISAIHNLFMTIVSLVLGVGIGWHSIRTYRDYGLYAVYCGTMDNAYDNKLGFWVNWFYLSKFYEFLDTIILALRKRELTLLHVFHHSITGPVSWMAMETEIIVGWITAFNNCVVHVFMYWYYFKQSLGINVWWKKYLTTCQIIQFFLDAVTGFPYLIIWYTGQECRGNIATWLVANVSGVVLIYLFVDFYINTYKKGKTKVT